MSLPGVEGRHDGPPPVDGDGEHGEHGARHRAQGDELVQGAVEGAVMPLPAQTCQPCLTMSMFRMESTLLIVGAKSGQITFSVIEDFCGMQTFEHFSILVKVVGVLSN